jgi:hypothetical protein
MCFGSFGSLILIRKIKDFDIRVYPSKFGTAHARAFPHRFLFDDKMTQMTQRLKPSARAGASFWVIWVNKKTMTQMTQRQWPHVARWRQLAT